MKNCISLLLCCTSFTLFAQTPYTYRSGGRIFDGEQKLTRSDIENSYGSNTAIMELYNSGKAKQTWGNVLLYGGVATLMIKHYTMIQNHPSQNGNVSQKSTNNIAYFVSFGMIAVAIPIKLGYPKKIKKAVELMNQEIQTQNSAFHIESLHLISNEKGIGIALNF